MNRFLSFMLLLFLSVGFATAQEKHSDMDVKVDVTVVDVDGNPLPGATLKRSDRKVGVVADVEVRHRCGCRKAAPSPSPTLA